MIQKLRNSISEWILNIFNVHMFVSFQENLGQTLITAVRPRPVFHINIYVTCVHITKILGGEIHIFKIFPLKKMTLVFFGAIFCS